MQKILSFLALALVICSCNAQVSGSIGFVPIKGVSAAIRIHDKSILIGACSAKMCNHDAMELDVDNTDSVSVAIEDYNFDGAADFSVEYLDEGKGTYTIHRVFLYSTKTMRFKEYFPRCGSEFINLKIDKNRRSLISTYFDENVAKQCVSHLPKNP
ncbi:XAC2610-related protein [Cupriavidus laharis]|uniref:XAC2610-related protein n=1 Tax=Cupriavidus laharis TaxID=151654 RepID=UPI001CC6E749|nr:hypothetical protein [Cupriavidus laharis]